MTMGGSDRGEVRRDAALDLAFSAPVLRGVDARGRRDLAEAGRARELAAGDAVFRAGEGGDAFFVVVEGEIALRAVRRGEAKEATLRRVRPGESFGEEVTVGATRRATAVAVDRARVLEIPVHLFRRAAGRSGRAEIAERLERTLRREATRELFRTHPLTRDLAEVDVDALLDAVEPRAVARGELVHAEGDPPGEVWLVADGLLQLQREAEGRLRVLGYLGPGDFFGDAEVSAGVPRRSSALASGRSLLIGIPAAAFLRLAARYPDLAPRLRRVAEAQGEEQMRVVSAATKNATAHVFRDLYRLQVARSLLVIDLDTCVRCGHCAWACADVHGTARLVRRGDKIVLASAPGGEPEGRAGGAEDERERRVRLPLAGGAPPTQLLLPNSCQHCEHPACMIDCPTGAIGRESGEVFVREELCTGCGACAKACPWDNIQIAPRAEGAARPKGEGDFGRVAVKCDLCRGYEGPACVLSCPTESIFRVNPAEDFAELRALFRAGGGGADDGTRRAAPGVEGRLGALGGLRWIRVGAPLLGAALGGAGVILHARGALEPGAGAGLGAGGLAGLAMLGLAAYAIPKRLVRRRLRKADGERRTAGLRSRVAPHARAHVALGVLAMGAAFAHSPWPSAARPCAGAATLFAFGIAAASGVALALAYARLPSRLARIERRAMLPEDAPEAGRELADRLFLQASGRSDLVKAVLGLVLLPYASQAAGPLALLLSGRSLREEERALRARVDGMLEGRGKERLAGLDELVGTVVETRALGARRLLTALLRAPLPVHVLSMALALALLGLHVAVALGSRRPG